MTHAGTDHDRTAAAGGGPRTLTVEHDDPRVEGLLAGLLEEYTHRYGADGAAYELSRYPVTEFVAPDGRMVLVELDGEIVAGGAVRPYRADRSLEPGTAEFKRIWTSDRHRRKGLARAVMGALEQAARDLGYTRVVLFTGPSQPEAVGLYERLGYSRVDPAAIDDLPYPRAIPFATDLQGPGTRGGGAGSTATGGGVMGGGMARTQPVRAAGPYDGETAATSGPDPARPAHPTRRETT